MCRSYLAFVGVLLAVCGCQPAADNRIATPVDVPQTQGETGPNVETKVASEPGQTPAKTPETAADTSPAKPATTGEVPAVKEAAPPEVPAQRKINIVRRPPRKANPDEAPEKAVPPAPPKMPVLLLSEEHAATCLVKVGDLLPDASLPDLQGQMRSLVDLRGEQLTVVFFWSCADRHSLQQLEDMGPDVASLFDARGVEVIGVNVRDEPALAKEAASKVTPTYPILLDSKGTFFNQVSTGRPPRTLLLDKDGKILWLDIEYTRITRRHLQEAILFLLQPAKIQAG
jgi:peroxiredoxin